MEESSTERLNARPDNLKQRITALHKWPWWPPIGAIGDALSGITSIALLTIAWYTVIPLYQNAMLQEKNARLERELENKQQNLNETQQNLNDTIKQVTLMDNNLQQAKTDLFATRHQNQDLQTLNIELVKGINTQRQEQSMLSKIIDDQHYERRALQTEIAQLKIEKDKRDESIIRYEKQLKEYVINQFVQKLKAKFPPTPNDQVLMLEMTVELLKSVRQDRNTIPTSKKEQFNLKDDAIDIFEKLRKIGGENNFMKKRIEEGLDSIEFNLLKQEDRELIRDRARKFLSDHHTLFDIDIVPKIGLGLSDNEFKEKLEQERIRINEVTYQFHGTLDKLAEYLRADF